MAETGGARWAQMTRMPEERNIIGAPRAVARGPGYPAVPVRRRADACSQSYRERDPGEKAPDAIVDLLHTGTSLVWACPDVAQDAVGTTTVVYQ